MAARVELTSKTIVAAMQSAKARAGLARKAEQIRARAAALAAAERAKVEPPRVESGTRPRGRSFSRVVIDDGAAQEFGTSRTERRRILGRAAGGA